MDLNPHLELIIGPMFSGKSTELIGIVNRYEKVHRRKVQIFKPIIDNRYGLNRVQSHDGLERDAIYIKTVSEMRDRTEEGTTVIGIEEAQFFESEIVDACRNYVDNNYIVIVSGLDKDFRDEFFPFSDGRLNMSELIRTADYKTYLHAFCTEIIDGKQKVCGGRATRTQKFIDGKVAPYDSQTVQVGGKESYAPRCRQHFQFYK